jgi:hypothetical protein
MSVEASKDGSQHRALAIDSLRALLADSSIPPSVRQALAADFEVLEAALGKLERGELHVAVLGRVSVGKSALLNALLGRPHFEVGVLHGTTTTRTASAWAELSSGAIHLIDTPGINEVDGAQREQLAHAVAARADLVLFVADGDLTATEINALRTVAAARVPLLLVLNKADRYTNDERLDLLQRLREHTRGIVRPQDVVLAAAQPAPQQVVQVDAQGGEQLQTRVRAPDIDALRTRMLDVLGAEGQTLSALNAGLFAAQFTDDLAQRVSEARATLADTLIRNYALAKGVAVGANPVPVADLLSAAALDIGLVVHLSRLYGMPLTRVEAGELVAKITGQLVVLMGAIWGVHLVSSALKTMSVGLSTALTAGAQGALAYYATFVIGRAAQVWLKNGKSWGEKGAKRMLKEVLATLDRNSILSDAREQILAKLRA